MGFGLRLDLDLDVDGFLEAMVVVVVDAFKVNCRLMC